MHPVVQGSSIAAAATGMLAAAPIAFAQCQPLHTFTNPRPVQWEQFGGAVALHGDRIAIAAPLSQGLIGVGRFIRAGAVYPFHDDGATWVAGDPIYAHDAAPGDRFGEDLALIGDRLIVGAGRGGAAYIYAAPPQGGPWALEAHVEGPGDGFGSRVAMTTGADGALRALICSPNDPPADPQGSVIVLRHDAGQWLEEARLTIESPGAIFGIDVAADGDTVAVTATTEDSWIRGGGSVHVFQRVDGAWTHVSDLSEEPTPLTVYGAAIALRGDVLAVNCPRNATHPTSFDPPGRIFIYRRDGAGWAREAVINEDGAYGDWYYGRNLGFVGELLAVDGAWTIDLFNPSGGAWEFVSGVRSPSGEALETIAGDRDPPARMLLGEPEAGGSQVGAAHLFSLAACFCRADLTGDGVLDFFDFLEFQSLFAAGDLRADFDDSGHLDFFDFLAFQEQFAAGCP